MKTKLTIGLIVLFISIKIAATANNCDYRYYMEEISGRYYPTFVREPCDRSVRITYKVYFSDGTSDQSRFVSMLSANFSVKERGIFYPKWGRIEIIREDWGELKSGSSHNYDNGNSTVSTVPSATDPHVPPELGCAILAGATAVCVIAFSNDFYFNKVESNIYNGYNFGLKNTMNRHIDLEYGASFFNSGNGILNPSFLKSDYLDDDLFRYQYSNYDTKTIWTLDINAIYNIIDRNIRNPIFSPYFGFGFSTFLNYETAKSGLGYIAGFSIGRRLKLHVRYKWLNNFEHNQVVINQLEFGLSFKYQSGILFKIF